MKKKTYSQEILRQFRPVQRKDGRWAILLQDGSDDYRSPKDFDDPGQGRPPRYLHWIETTDNKPCTVSDPDMSMQSWHFQAEALAIIDWLRSLWSEDPNVEPGEGSISVTVDLDDEGKEKLK